MPYVKGETPMVGDRVQNRFGKIGKVKHVELDAANLHAIVGVEFEGGGVSRDPLHNGAARGEELSL